MSRYATFTYSAKKYGATTNTNLLWYIGIDWDGDGFGEGENEAIDGGLVGLIIRRGRKDYLVRSGKGFAHNQVGTAIITLENPDGRYDPYNTSSEIYPNVSPGKSALIKVKLGNEGAYKSIFAGIIDDIQPIMSNRRVQITLLDGWRHLLDNDVSIGVKSSYRMDEAISDILTEVGYPWSKSLSEADHSVDNWWATDKNAANAINELVDAEFGSCAVLGDGTFEFQSRGFSGASEFSITQSELLKDITSPQPWETIRNVVSVNVYPKKTVSNVDLYEENDTPSIAPSDSLTVEGRLTYDGRSVACNTALATKKASDDFIYDISGCTSPDFDGEYFDNGTDENGDSAYTNRTQLGFMWWDGVDSWIISDTQGTAGNDYFKRTNADPVGEFTLQGNAEGSPDCTDNPDITFNAQADGGGADLTADISVTVTLMGEDAEFVFANGGGTLGYLTKFRFRGNAIDTPSSSKVKSDQSGTDVKRLFELDTPWINDYEYGAGLAAYVAYVISAGRQFPILNIEQRPTYQFAVDLNDRIDVVIDKLTIDETYKVIYIEHRFLMDTGQSVLTTLVTEASPDVTYYLQFDSGRFDHERFGL